MIKGRLLIANNEYKGPTDGRYILLFKRSDNGIYLSSDAGKSFRHTGITTDSYSSGSAAISGDGRYMSIVQVIWGTHMVHRSADFGKTWSTNSQSADFHQAIRMSNDGLVQITTTNGQYFRMSGDYGNYFNYIDTGIYRSGMRFLAMSDDGLTAMASSDSGSSYPLISRDTGLSWMDETRLSSAVSYGIAVSGDGKYCLVVYGDGTSRPFHRSQNWGFDWISVSSPANTWAGDAQISHTGKYQCFTETAYNGIHFSDDYGVTWNNIAGYVPIWGQYLMPCADENIRFMTSFNTPFFYKSTNGGNSWEAINTGSNQYNILAVNKYLGQ